MLTKAHLRQIRSGRVEQLRFAPDAEIDWEPGQRIPATPELWFVAREWWFDPDTDEIVYEVRKCPMPDRPRLLVPRGRAGDGLGYTDKAYLAMRDEPECVDEKTQADISRDGWTGFRAKEKQRLLDRRLLALEERLRLAWGDGQRLRIDLSDNLKAIDRIVSSMERKTDQSDKAA